MYQGKDVDGAERQARLALSINPNLAEGHAVLGHLLWVQFRDGGSAELRQAVELNPNDAVAQYYYGEYLLMQSGKNSDALMHLNRARELDPMSLLHRQLVGIEPCGERQHRRGREALDDHPGTLSRHWPLRAFPHPRYRGPTG